MRAMASANMAMLAALVALATARGGMAGCAIGLAAFVAWRLTHRVGSASRLTRSIGPAAALVIVGIALTVYLGTAIQSTFPSVEPLTTRLANFGTDPSSLGRIIL